MSSTKKESEGSHHSQIVLNDKKCFPPCLFLSRAFRDLSPLFSSSSQSFPQCLDGDVERQVWSWRTLGPHYHA